MTSGGAGAGRIRDRLAIILLAAGIALLLFARFNSINGVIHPYLQRAVDPNLYALDVFINKAVIKNSSILFNLLDYLAIDLTNPVFIISSYVLISIVAGAAVDRLLKSVFSVRELPLRMALLFALIFADAKFVILNKAGWILEHNFSLSFIGCALRLWFLYFALSRNFLAMAVVLIPINLVAIKVGWPLVGFAVLLLLQARHRSPLTWAMLILSLVVPVISALQTQGALAAGERAAIFEIFKLSHPFEDNPFAGPLLQYPLYLGGTALAWLLVGRIEPRVAAPVRTILLASLLIFLGGGFYLEYLSAFFPVPMAVLLSPARALELSGFVIYLVLLLWVARTTFLVGLERGVAMLGLLLLKLTPDYKWVVIGLALALAAVGLRALRWAIEKRGGTWPLDIPGMSLPLGLALLAPLIGIFFAFNLSGQRTVYRYDPLLGFYDAATPADALPMLRAVAAEKADRRIIFASASRGVSKAAWSMQARKSGIAGDPYYLSRLSDIREQAAANAVEERLFEGLRRGRVDADVAHALAAYRATLIIPSSLASAVAGWRVARLYGNWREVAPPGD
jgi:hypothetical protein